MPLDRTWYNTLVNDDGSNTVGSPWEKEDVDALMDAIDAALLLYAPAPATAGHVLTSNGAGVAPSYQVAGGGIPNPIVQDLLFTDALYDIGKVGATRPRDGFFSRNLVIGGTLGVTGVATLTAQAVLTGGFQTGAAIGYINDNSNAKMTAGLTVNQGANDDEILSFKSSDITHGMTTITETDTYAYFRKRSATAGGLVIQALTSTGVGGGALLLQGTNADAVDSSKNTGANGVIRIVASIKSGTSDAVLGANGNMVSFETGPNATSTTRFILDGDGDSHQDVGTAWTNYDDGDDVARLDALAVTLAREGDPLREQFVRHFEDRRALIEAMPGKPLVTFNAEGHHFVNMSRLAMLHTGAIRQLGAQVAALTAQNRALEARLERSLHG